MRGGIDARAFAFPGSGDVEGGNSVFADPVDDVGDDFGFGGGVTHHKLRDKQGPAQLPRGLHGEPRTRAHRTDLARKFELTKDKRRIRITDVRAGPRRIVPPGGLAQGIEVRDRTVFGPAAGGGPAATGNTKRQGGIQRGPVHTGLPAGYDPQPVQDARPLVKPESDRGWENRPPADYCALITGVFISNVCSRSVAVSGSIFSTTASSWESRFIAASYICRSL